MSDADLSQNVLTAATAGLIERLDRDLHGAYRAGYTYLYIGHPRLLPHDYTEPPYTTPTPLHIVTIPTHTELPPRVLPDEYNWTRCNLDMPADTYRTLVADYPGGIDG